MSDRRDIQITQRDWLVLAMLAEHRVAVVPQLAALLEVGEAAAGRRLRSLAGAGLIGHRRVFAGHPAAVWITSRGLGSIERRLPAPRIDLKGYRHDVGVGWLWLAAHRGAFGALSNVISEREMRSHDGRLRGPDRADRAEPYGIGIGGVGPNGLRQRHYPDLMLDTAGGRRIAVELELTSKGRSRLEAIMRGYAGDPSVDGILYLVPDARLARQIQDAASNAHIGDLVRVQRIARDGIEGAPAPLERTPASAGAPTRGGGRRPQSGRASHDLGATEAGR